MKILNAMFGKAFGGMEQSFLDYTAALSMRGNEVLSIVHPKAAVISKIEGGYAAVHNFNQFDVFAIHRLSKLILEEAPDIIITHGSRAAALFKRTKTRVPIIAVAHNNHKHEQLIGADAVIAVNAEIARLLTEKGQSYSSVYVIPNMISSIPKVIEQKPASEKVVIGVIARLSQEKGIDFFLNSIAGLKNRGVAFSARIAGDGPDAEKCKALAAELELLDVVEFLGWVDDKDAFYSSIDILCIPSEDEAFGIVALEAMSRAVPVLSTPTSGAIEIKGHSEGIKIADRAVFADAIYELIDDKNARDALGLAGHARVSDFAMPAVGALIQGVLEGVYKRSISCKVNIVS